MTLDRVVNIGGAPSSGTTLVADYLDAIPGVLCGPEANLFCCDAAWGFDEEFKRAARRGSSFPSNSIYAPQTRFFNRRHSKSFGVGDEWLGRSILESSTLQDFVSALADQFSVFRTRTCHLFAEKTPSNIGYVGEFLEIFESGCFVWVIRDGRAVVDSLCRRGYEPIEAGLIWLHQNGLALPFAGSPRVFLVRFEDFLARPLETTRVLASRMGVTVSLNELSRNLREDNYRDTLPRVETWRAAGRNVVASRSDAWRRSLPGDVVALLEGLTVRASNGNGPLSFRDLLLRFGYEPAASAPATNLERHVATYAERSSHLEAQATVDFSIGATRICAPARNSLELDAAPPGALPSMLGVYRFLPIENEPQVAESICAKALSTVARSVWLEPTRTYHLRVTHVDCSELCRNPERLPSLAPFLAELYFQLLSRRAEVGQSISIDDAAVLLLSLHEYEEFIGGDAPARSSLRTQALSVLGEELAAAIDRGELTARLKSDCPLFARAVAPRSQNARCRLILPVASIAQRLFTDSTNGIRMHAVDSCMLRLMSPCADARKDAGRELIAEYLDPPYGMIVVAGARGRGPRRYYTRPLALLAMIRLSRLERERRRPASSSQDARLARRTGGAGLHARASADRVAAYACRLREVPDLAASWKPGATWSTRSEFDRAMAISLHRALLEFQSVSIQVVPVSPTVPLVLSVRHDVDRPLTSSQLDRILSVERELCLQSSWFFKPETWDPKWGRILLAGGCEIGYHASHPPTGDAGFAARLRSEVGDCVVGSTFHGGFGSQYWSGKKTLDDIARLGFVYSEWPSDLFDHPMAWASTNGTLYLAPASIKIQSHAATTERHLSDVLDCRGHAIVEDHPDRFDTRTETTLQRLSDLGALARTIGAHVASCRAADEIVAHAQRRRLSDGSMLLAFDASAEVALTIHGVGLDGLDVEAGDIRIVNDQQAPSTVLALVRQGLGVRLLVRPPVTQNAATLTGA